MPINAEPASSQQARPEPPWGKFPLTELAIFAALVIGVIALLSHGDNRATLAVIAAAIGSLAGLELAIREHRAGYRSHTTLLAAIAAVVVLTLTSLAIESQSSILLIAKILLSLLVFAVVFSKLRRLFKERSGGLTYR